MNMTFLTIRRNLQLIFKAEKADFVMMICDFNAKSCNWSINDITTQEGAHLDCINPYME